LMFGTDTEPILLPDWGYFEVYEKLVLPDSVEEKIFRANARRIFGLPVVA
jgi:predicted TIM-barrel fold metal-dependent hydrolase